ncbi:hypothetical protein [Ornithinimicrobium sp. W1665]
MPISPHDLWELRRQHGTHGATVGSTAADGATPTGASATPHA